ncbi:MAG: hypothetical protein ACR2OE_05900, partial [Thermomicrobiales bacterium]
CVALIADRRIACAGGIRMVREYLEAVEMLITLVEDDSLLRPPNVSPSVSGPSPAGSSASGPPGRWLPS